MVSWCRALLFLQLINQADTVRLDHWIIQQVHERLGLPFRPSSVIATLPLKLGRFEFLLIAHINAGIAVDGLVRNLNHHIPAYHLIVHIMLVDWMCQTNQCCYFLDRRGLSQQLTRFADTILSTWIIVQECLAKLNISLRQTNQSHILDRNCSISHAISLVRPHLQPPNLSVRHAIRSIKSMGYWSMKDIGVWGANNVDGIITFRIGMLPEGRWSTVQKRNWGYISELFNKARIDMLYSGQLDLLLFCEVRRDLAENFIMAFALLRSLSPMPEAISTNNWGLDSSMIPASTCPFDPKSVIAAATGPMTVTFRLQGQNISILHGELMGLIAGIIVASLTQSSGLIHSDHLNSVWIVEDSQMGANLNAWLRHSNGCSYYCWILALIGQRDMSIRYTKNHLSQSSLSLSLNNAVDHHTVEAQKKRNTPIAPISTFFMD